AFTIVPRHVLGGPGYTAPSDLPNIAGIGFGSQGGSDIMNIATPEVAVQRQGMGMTGIRWYQYPGITPPRPERRMDVNQRGDADAPQAFKHANIYALCDVDHNYAAHIFGSYPKAKAYHDFREMIDKEKSLDAVVIGTPDHLHAVIAAYAMRAGLHVFVEKPMTKTIYEARYLTKLAKETGVITQMGNQGHNIEGTMQTVEWIRSGIIGDVTEVHMWSNRPVWAQGWEERPAGQPVPDHLKYDLWLGPAPEKPYSPDCTHFAWRGLWDYGTGAMGDMGAHTFDAPIWALDLGMPETIQATTTPFTKDYLPQAENVEYTFGARGNKPPVKVTWSDGGIKPFRPKELEANRQLRECLYVGTKGMIQHGTHGASPELIPENPDFKEPAKTLARPKSVYVDFIDAIKEGRKAANDFEIASKLTEIMLLTNIAVVSQQVNITLEYDAKNMKITNLPEANDYFHYEYRKGWSLEG
ncbi:MAG: Gfo/Idh/MocA family oxidoreductase, partial [Bacteroidales bacterium]